MQATHTPLWNEVLELPIVALPCHGTLQLEVSCNTEQMLGNLDFGSTFSFIVTDNLETGFSDEWLVDSRTNSSQDWGEPRQINSGDSLRLHISCSFDQAIVRSLQVGLWPSHEVKSLEFRPHELKLSELMSKTSFVYRARQQSDFPSIQLSEPHSDPKPTLRNGSPSRSRKRLQRGCSEYYSETAS